METETPAASAPNTRISSLNEKMNEIARVERASISATLSPIRSHSVSAKVITNSRSIRPPVVRRHTVGVIRRHSAGGVAKTSGGQQALQDFQHHFDMMRKLHLAKVQEHYQLQKQMHVMNVQKAQWKHDKFQFMRDFKDFKARLNENIRLIQNLKEDKAKLRNENAKLKGEINDLQKQKSDLTVKNKDITKQLKILDGSSEELFSYTDKKLRRLKRHLQNNLVIIKERLKKCENCKARYKDIAFTCGHKVLCSKCAKKTDTCPVCNKKIDLANSITIADEY